MKSDLWTLFLRNIKMANIFKSQKKLTDQMCNRGKSVTETEILSKLMSNLTVLSKEKYDKNMGREILVAQLIG